MKKLLFLSLFISVPLWGMEVAPGKALYVKEAYCKVDPEKEEAFKILKENYYKGTEQEAECFLKGKKALKQLKIKEDFYLELSYMSNSDYHKNGDNWLVFYVLNRSAKKPRFNYDEVKPLLEDIPYIEKVVTKKEFEKIKIAELLAVLNRKKKQ